MKKVLISSIIALGLIAAGSSFSNYTEQAGIPTEHSISKSNSGQIGTISTFGIPTEH
jgi:hypothetical protein